MTTLKTSKKQQLDKFDVIAFNILIKLLSPIEIKLPL